MQPLLSVCAGSEDQLLVLIHAIELVRGLDLTWVLQRLSRKELRTVLLEFFVSS